MKFFNKLQILFLSIVVLLVAITGMMSMRPKETHLPESETFYCGNAFIEKSTHPYGEKLFKEDCRACHRIDTEVVGPALRGVTQRRSRAWLYEFIQNSQAMIKKGDRTAVDLYIKYHRTEMPAFETMSTADMDSILVYIELSDF